MCLHESVCMYMCIVFLMCVWCISVRYMYVFWCDVCGVCVYVGQSMRFLFGPDLAT